MDRQIAERARQAIRRYADTEHGDLRRLQGTEPEYRLRVGDWRVRVRLDRSAGSLTVLRVLPRGRAYRS